MFHEGEGRLHQLRRMTVARSALDVIALIFLGSSLAFWGVAFWQLLRPPSLISALMIQVGVLALVYALATPLLWSALVPTTPAGQLLQKTQWRTFGFAFIVGAAFYLSWQGNMLIEAWLYAQPGVAEAGMARMLSLSLSIAFVLIPALAWTQLTPERWLGQIQQAHAVKKLEIQQSGEIAIIKARLLWAEQRAALSYANLLPAEQAEIRDTLQGLLMGIADTQRGIARTLGISAELERVYPALGDKEIAEHMAYVAQVLERPAEQLEGAMRIREDDRSVEVDAEARRAWQRAQPGTFAQRERDADAFADRMAQEVGVSVSATLAARRAARQAEFFASVPAEQSAGRGGARPSAIPAAPPRPAPEAAPPRPAAPRRAPPRYAAEYDSARGKLAGTWSAAQLGEVLDKSERTARDRIAAWEDARLVARDVDGKGSFYFTEESEADHGW